MKLASIAPFVAGLFGFGWQPGGEGKGRVCHPVHGREGSAALSCAAGDPTGMAHAVWTGTGAAGTFLAGAAFFGDTSGAMRLVSAALVVAGVVRLKPA